MQGRRVSQRGRHARHGDIDGPREERRYAFIAKLGGARKQFRGLADARRCEHDDSTSVACGRSDGHKAVPWLANAIAKDVS
jgi:hypothetical protein